MKIPVFWKLCELLQSKLEHHYKDPCDANLKNKHIPNGPISHSIRVSIALSYLAGGAPLDIALVHGVSHCEVFKCVWEVIDAINNEPQLGINFPESHFDQLFIAKQFQAKSRADFTNCVGAIDGMLVWIQKPTWLQVKENRLR
jgi:hypothetical protein